MQGHDSYTIEDKQKLIHSIVSNSVIVFEFGIESKQIVYTLFSIM